MDDKLSVFWNLDVLVKMCRSKSDGPSLRIEEVEILEKIKSYKQEIEEINIQNEEESYDTSAEMADRNIEIITKKQLQTLKATLKENNKQLNELKEREQNIYTTITLLKETKKSQEKYVTSMQERVNETTDYEVMDRYNALIAETTEKLNHINDDLEEKKSEYDTIQENIMELTEKIKELEEKIDKKKRLLDETRSNLENKDNYIDQNKKEKNNKRIKDLEEKILKLNKRLEELRKDPKYLESKIKDVINNKETIENAKSYLITLINIVIRQPYINVPADNALEEELLKATQARDSFANEIDQKSYNILEADTPEKIRTDFLTLRISKWQEELKELKSKVDLIDKDREFNYEEKNHALYNMIDTMKNDVKEFQKAYEDTPDTSISYKASLKAQIDEKKEDIIEAEKIATAFRKDESDDITRATKTMKYECELIAQNIAKAEEEIKKINNRLTTKRSGLIDITSKNKDKDILKELAQTVIDIKHRRQFPETPLEIVHKLEESLGLELETEIDKNVIDNNSNIEIKDYEEYTTSNQNSMPVEIKVTSDFDHEQPQPKRGIKVINEATISKPIEESIADEEDDSGEEISIQNPFGFTYEELPEEIEEDNNTEKVFINEEPVELEENNSLDASNQQEVQLETTLNEETGSEETFTESVLANQAIELISEEPQNTTISDNNEVIPEETEIEKISTEEIHTTEEIEEKEEVPVEENFESEKLNIIEETEEKKELKEETEKVTDDLLDKEIDAIIGLMSSNNERVSDEEITQEVPEEETPLDIDEIINSATNSNEENSIIDNDLSISSIFNNTSEEKNDKMSAEPDMSEFNKVMDEFKNPQS